MAENSTHPLQNSLPEKRNNNKSNFTFWDNFPETQKDMIAINRIILKHVNTFLFYKISLKTILMSHYFANQ